MKTLLLLLLPVLAFGAGPVISGITHSESASTSILQWTTDSAASSLAHCGTSTGVYTINGVDDGVQTSVTAHYDIVASLAPSTLYFCTVTSVNGGGSTTSPEFQLTTTAAPASTAITGVTFTSPAFTKYNVSTFAFGSRYNAQYPTHWHDGDTFNNAACADGITYLAVNDTHNFQAPLTGTAFTDAYGAASTSNQSINSLVGGPPVGTLINLMAGWLPAITNGADGRNAKEFGAACINDQWNSDLLYMTTTRQVNSTPFNHVNGGILKSPDHGVTWANWDAPTTYNSNGSPTSPVTSNMLGGTNNAGGKFSQLNAVLYQPGGGTTPRVDGQDAYVYWMASGVVSTSSQFSGGDADYLIRVPRSKIASLSGADYQFYVGGDGSLDAAWSSSSASASAILSSTGRVSSANIQHISTLNRYIMLNWYYIAGTTSISEFVFLEAPAPWGPWTECYRQLFQGQGYFNPNFDHLGASTAALTSSGNTLRMMFPGDYNIGCGNVNTTSCLYQAHYIDVQLSAKPRFSMGAGPNNVPRQGLTAAWDFRYFNSTAMLDVSKQGFNIPITTFEADRFAPQGKIFNRFDGTLFNTGLFTQPDGTGFGDITLVVVYLHTSVNGSPTNFEKLVTHKNSGASSFDLAIQRNGTTANSMGCSIIDDSVSPFGVYVSPVDDTWNMITCRRTGSAVTATLNNGSATAPRTTASTALNTTRQFVLGKTGLFGDDAFDGALAAVLIWNRALSDQEVLNTYRVMKLGMAPYGVSLP